MIKIQPMAIVYDSNAILLLETQMHGSSILICGNQWDRCSFSANPVARKLSSFAIVPFSGEISSIVSIFVSRRIGSATSGALVAAESMVNGDLRSC